MSTVNLIPNLAPPLQNTLSDLRGFSVQEDWGRWTLGSQAEVVFDLERPQQVVLFYEGALPLKEQTLQVTLDGRAVGSFRQPEGQLFQPFAQKLLLSLPAGLHRLKFTTNVSNRDGVTPPFAPDDHRDLGVKLSALTLQTPSVGPLGDTATDWRSPIYNVYPHLITPAYLPAGKDGVALLFLHNADRVPALKYSLLRAFPAQTFQVSLDGGPPRSLPGAAGGHLVQGTLPLPPTLSPGQHRLNITSEARGTASPRMEITARTTLPNGEVGFAVQYLSVQPTPRFPDVPLGRAPLAAALALVLALALLLGLLYLLLFGTQKPASQRRSAESSA
ncbi:hypothetical protein [Deinococcus geothermalis]|uniref:hypothetical protein n=1 Tax=Deinococcus geothermalis TaxID=68909 RepID=UPI002353B6AD|nr:hypothetical protein [Deinococcus geothermalis]